MIRSFADVETRSVWEGRRSRRLPGDIQVPALRKLRLLNQARRFDDLRIPPGNRLELLRGDRAGPYGIPINRPWRIGFRWENGHAEDVAIVDYHEG